MNFFQRTIFTGFSPNLTTRAVGKACGFLLLPWNWRYWRKGKSIGKGEHWLQKYFGVKHAFTFDSGRSALYYALKGLGAGEGDEVLVQAYTCVVVVNAIRWTGATPVYVDIEDDLNMNPEEVEKKVTGKTKIIMIQHTFGMPAKMDELLAIAAKHHIKIIEDCAHSLGARYKGKLTGTFGDVAMLSFGSDKVVSCVRGGALITNDDGLAQKIKEYSSRLPQTDRLLIFQHLMHFPLFFIGKALYRLKVGKWLLAFAKKFHLINRIMYPPEKHGKQVQFYPAQLPNALADILLDQLNKLEQTNTHREAIARLYDEKLNKKLQRQSRAGERGVFLDYPVLVENPEALQKKAKKQGILLGLSWSGSVIVPKGIDIKPTGYRQGSCPNAEKVANTIILLPTNRNITKSDAKKISEFINRTRLPAPPEAGTAARQGFKRSNE